MTNYTKKWSFLRNITENNYQANQILIQALILDLTTKADVLVDLSDGITCDQILDEMNTDPTVQRTALEVFFLSFMHFTGELLALEALQNLLPLLDGMLEDFMNEDDSIPETDFSTPSPDNI